MRWILIPLFAFACSGTGQIKIGDDTSDTDPCRLDPDRTDCIPVNQEWYPDEDGDNFGLNGSRFILSPTQPGPKWALGQGDCDDVRPDINPLAPETCDGEDDDCDGMVDDGLDECHPGDSPGDTDLPDDTDPVLPTETGDSADSGPSDSGDPTDSAGDPETDPPLETDLAPDTDSPPDTDLPDDTDPDPETDIPDDSGHSDSADSADTSSETGVPETDLPPETDIVPDTDDPPPDTDLPDDTDPDPETDIPDDTAPTFIPEDTSYTDTDVDSDILVNDDTADSDPPVIYRNYYRDGDGDGQGAGTAVYATAPPLGHVENNNDCDDEDPDIYRGAVEVCNGLDDDCDGTPDDGLRLFRYYADGDGDGYGDPVQEVQACGQPLGAVEGNSDCNDGDGLVYPGADEVCNGYDDDCDAFVDADALDAFLVYYDGDGDGQGAEEDDGRWTCTLEDGDSLVGTDCDDGDSSVMAGDQSLDLCGDGVDQNCDGNPDNNPGGSLDWYTDYDSDGYGALTGPVTTACGQPASPQTARVRGDCNDAAPGVNPGAQEVCDELNLDDDCDGRADDLDSSTEPSSESTWYIDSDQDGYGGEETVQACDQAPSLFTLAEDCNDGDPAFNPGEYDWADPVDWDCDGQPWPDAISVTVTGQTVEWVSDVSHIPDWYPTPGLWAATLGGQPPEYNQFQMPAGGILQPGPTSFVYFASPAGCLRRAVAVPNDGGEYSLGLVLRNTQPGAATLEVRLGGVSLGSSPPIGQGTEAQFVAFGPFFGTGQAQNLDLCVPAADPLPHSMSVVAYGLLAVERP